MRTQEFKDQCGYFSFVQNTDVNYLELAYTQALSIKCTQRINKYAIAVDLDTKQKITDKHLKVFDYIIDIPFGDDSINDTWKLRNSWKLYSCTPFKETIHLDSDILFTRDISHWWDMMRLKEICITTNVVNYRGDISTNRYYRKLFDSNNLLNTYSGFSYFRYSKIMKSFFDTCRVVIKNWDIIKNKVLKDCRSEIPTTDEVYAIAASFVGTDNCFLPSTYPMFCHMKPKIQDWNHNEKWTDTVSYAFTNDMDLIVNGYYQMYPFHYQLKDFITDELVGRYEKRYSEIIK